MSSAASNYIQLYRASTDTTDTAIYCSSINLGVFQINTPDVEQTKDEIREDTHVSTIHETHKTHM